MATEHRKKRDVRAQCRQDWQREGQVDAAGGKEGAVGGSLEQEAPRGQGAVSHSRGLALGPARNSYEMTIL